MDVTNYLSMANKYNYNTIITPFFKTLVAYVINFFES